MKKDKLREDYEIKWEVMAEPNFWDKIGQEGVYPQEMLGITDEVLNSYYIAARDYIEEENYSEAKDAFTFLTFLTPAYANFWFGLGYASQVRGEFQEAINAYEIAKTLDSENPSILANLFQCEIAMDKRENAEVSLQRCLELCGDKEEFNEIKEKVMEKIELFENH